MSQYRQAEYSELNYPEDILSIIRNGLRRGSVPKSVLIIGAGISGLVAASLLKQAGHKVTIIEGNNRIGGRIYTVREPFSKGYYLDMGAMRIPNTHVLAFEYIRRFKLKTAKFINTSPRDVFFVNNVITSRAYYEENPDVLAFPVAEWEKGKTATELFLSAVKPFIDKYQNSTDEQKEAMKKEYARYSMGEFLRFNPIGRPLSLNAIRKINVLLGIEGFPEFSFVDILTDIIYPIFNEETKFFEIVGGNDRLPLSFLPELRWNIFLNQKVERIIQDQSGVTLQTRNPTNGEFTNFHGDIAIVTVPFPVFQFIDVVPYHSISFKKWQAIGELMLLPAVKVGIEFKNRFWENFGIGNIISDKPTRFTYTPSHNKGSSGPAILLASYSWAANALLWNSLSEEDIIRYVLKDLSKVYGNVVYREYIRGVSFNWSRNPFSAGCFTLFTPNQETDIADFIRQPEGKLHFAGEHTSNFHGWIEGGIESGVRAAFEVNHRK
ncbi:flavin monoamine oxidase family protein [Pseudalkalibacillus caeni]|uniref:Flavin monoamine oxidase family protein n=1 Tax=Exobacillus caeni TaxID=2574798 RepID=A0A5R9F1J9_9BACL|nr:flavin monoamine oxidase family protein [Pseudalkalibacillus caeni]TLS36891.1 flavin monoamine oxidase family protein [Pseudalkalibacillus caeni]